MDRSDGTGPTGTRREFLAGGAGLVATAGLPGVTRAAPSSDPTATVLTRNVYLGVDLSKLLGVESLEELESVASEFRDQIDSELYGVRADAIAGEVEATGADVVALQEAGTVRAERAGGADSGDAGTEGIDFLSRITGALADRGLGYEVAAETVTTELTLTAVTGDGPVDVRLADRDALLVRSAVDVADPASGTFDATKRVRLADGLYAVTLRRGFCTGEVTVDGVGFTAVTTHLESVAKPVRRRQAGELLDLLPSDRPVVLAGDLNSGPGGETETYDRLTRSFEDVQAVRRPGADWFTCCQASDLRNEQSRLDRRIDAVLYRGGVRPTAVERVGHRPADRVEATVDGESVRVWPSDHAGVAATLRLPEPTDSANEPSTVTTSVPTTPSPAERAGTPRRSTTGTDASTGTSSASGAGGGTLATVAGIGAAIWTALGRETRDGTR